MIRTVLVVLAGICVLGSSALAERAVVETKSFIARIDTGAPGQFDPANAGCQAAMATVINCTLKGEDPKTGSAASADFRLRSAVTIDATCTSGKLTAWTFSPVATATGNELIWLTTTGELAAPLKVSPAAPGAAPAASVAFSYRMRGQPNIAGNLAMEAAKHRNCSFIWHQIDGRLTCKGNSLAVDYSVGGSAFPSIRSWKDGKLVKQIEQGPFKSLWDCDPTDPTSVR